MQLLMAAPFKPQRPQKQGLCHRVIVHFTPSQMCQVLLLALCKGRKAAPSYSTQPTERPPTGALSAWECKGERRRLSEAECLAKLKWGYRERAAKASELPAASRHPEGTYPVLHQLCAGAVRSCTRCTTVLKERRNASTLILTEAEEREPRQEGSPTSGAQHCEKHQGAPPASSSIQHPRARRAACQRRAGIGTPGCERQKQKQDQTSFKISLPGSVHCQAILPNPWFMWLRRVVSCPNSCMMDFTIC